jgi:DNA-binding NtrC family response regulator
MAAILIVEDDQQVRVLTESVLADAGHQTFSAATTQEALAIIEANAVSVDILFVDIGLALDEAAGAVNPGIDLAKQAVAIRADLSVLYTTGQGVTDGMKALFVARSDFLAKPYKGGDLVVKIGELRSRKETRPRRG